MNEYLLGPRVGCTGSGTTVMRINNKSHYRAIWDICQTILTIITNMILEIYKIPGFGAFDGLTKKIYIHFSPYFHLHNKFLVS